MSRVDIVSLATEYVNNSPNNYIAEDIAIHPRCVGMKIFEAPIFAFGSADDDLYVRFKSFSIIGSHFISPAEWLPSAKTVISFFLPYTDIIKAANSIDSKWPADEWLQGRYEGHIFINQLLEYLVENLSEAGCKSLAPSLDQRYKVGNTGDNKMHTSNWSERHAAYTCGLGTFGLSKGLITTRGICGRFGSVITELDLPKDSRNYSDIYEYCAMCGLCINRCPVHAISIENGKNSLRCSDFLEKVRGECKPRYGCGKCQTNVPCESRIPKVTDYIDDLLP